MLSGLERLVRVSKTYLDARFFFFLSNGFLVQNRRGDTDTSETHHFCRSQSGVVIYSIDTRGLTPPKSSLSDDTPFDPYGTLSRSTHGENFAIQDGLSALSHDTGGRMIINTNDFRPGVKAALNETAIYYLLAWKPDPENKKPGRFRNIQVSVSGRPELVVRVRKGFFDVEPAPPVAETKSPTTPEGDTKILVTKLTRGDLRCLSEIGNATHAGSELLRYRRKRSNHSGRGSNSWRVSHLRSSQ
jgi:hypothetical protein